MALSWPRVSRVFDTAVEGAYLVANSCPELCALASCCLHFSLAGILLGVVLFLLDLLKLLLVVCFQFLVQAFVPRQYARGQSFPGWHDVALD